MNAPKRLQTVRQHLQVDLDGVGVIEVTTRPFDYDLWATTRKRHDWPDASDSPVTFLTFVAWSAARRAGVIGSDLTWEKFLAAAADVAELEPEPVDPTRPGPGPG